MNRSSYKITRPDTEIRGLVDYFWEGEVCLDSTRQTSFEYLAPASTAVDLIFFNKGYFKDSLSEKTIAQNGIIYGQKASFNRYSTTSKQATIFGIKLKSSFVFHMLRVPASEITGHQVDLRTLLGCSGDRLTELILSSHSMEEKADTFTRFLKGQQREVQTKFRALEKLIASVDFLAEPSEISNQLGSFFLSRRQFERDFKTLTGFSVRKFSRLKRFELFFQAIQSNQLTSSFTQAAYQFGYYDQAHLNRDFKEFTGVSPKRYADTFLR
ncbi:AraC family transcriptional regulator [Chitinophaga oryzae]|uniref:AraC family transcriptional regulator n=1 Tax=Chitinophaga oryzae TaxID=2725414 RepID=A0AAE7D529_9BACT|nr:helix-turn-helix domain-containing protein [Chitinophaga oryzae]QJB30163.1 AraC family transcriptional regulator [Chitinophaga oryzae]QJB36661.1 AraC family transcriptional regulator [Chitinophaga oryzae]